MKSSPYVYLVLGVLSLAAAAAVPTLVMKLRIREVTDLTDFPETGLASTDEAQTRPPPSSSHAPAPSPPNNADPRGHSEISSTLAAAGLPSIRLDSSAVDAARQEVRLQLGEAIRNADQPEEKVKLASDLLQQAQAPQGTDETKVALLREATDLAAAGGDLPSAFAAIDLLEKNYGIDGWELRQQLLGSSVNQSQPDQTAIKLAADQLDAAVAAGKIEAAVKLTDMLQSSVARLRDPTLRKSVQARVRHAKKMKRSWVSSSKDPDEGAGRAAPYSNSAPTAARPAHPSAAYSPPPAPKSRTPGVVATGPAPKLMRAERGSASRERPTQSEWEKNITERGRSMSHAVAEFLDRPLVEPRSAGRAEGGEDASGKSSHTIGSGNVRLSGPQYNNAELASIAAETALSDLTLEDTPIDGSGLESLRRMISLTSLTIRRMPIRDEDLAALSALRGLTVVELEEVPLTGEGIRHLAAVQRLKIRNLRLTAAGLKEIARLPRLRILELVEVPLAGQAWHPLRYATRLSELHLEKVAFSDAELFLIPNLMILRELTLVDVRVTADGLAALKLPTLRKFTLDRESFTKPEIERLQRILPKCQISTW